MSSIPKSGNEVISRGRMAQWMAQARDAVTPSRSQLNLLFMGAKIAFGPVKMQLCCKLYVNLVSPCTGGFTFAL